MEAVKPCGNCRHPDCVDCYPRSVDRYGPTSLFDSHNENWASRELKALTKKGTFVKAIFTIEDGTITRLEERRSKKP